MSNDLVVKNPNLPLKAYPKETLEKELDSFMLWINNLLGLRGEESAKRMVLAMPAIEKKFWSMGIDEIKKAFEMYADGELKTKPMANYFDRILVGQVFNEYKDFQRTNASTTKKTDEATYKAEQDYIYIVSAYDHFISTGNLGEESAWIYSYLTDTKKVVQFDAEVRKELFNKYYEKLPKQEAITASKLEILEQYFTKLNSKGTHIKNIIK